MKDKTAYVVIVARFNENEGTQISKIKEDIMKLYIGVENTFCHTCEKEKTFRWVNE